MYPEISKNICRLLHVSMESALNHIRPLKTYLGSSNAPGGSPPINSLEVPMFDRELTGSDVKNKFFYDQWKSEIVQYEDLNDIVKILETWLEFVGPNLYLDTLLVGKIIRLGYHHITTVLIFYLDKTRS